MVLLYCRWCYFTVVGAVIVGGAAVVGDINVSGAPVVCAYCAIAVSGGDAIFGALL